MSKVTVVVPVYNIESYFRKCIESIITQTFKDIEIILIDDGSTDSSGIICDEYSGKDSRIRVIHKEHEGLSCARNDGISSSSSPYIMFVDGDDWVEPLFCELPYNTAIESGADFILFNHYSHNVEKSNKTKVCFKEGIISQRQALDMNGMYDFTAAWSALYKRELFDNITFPPGKYYEDVGTTHRLIHMAKKIYYIDRCLYHYVKNRPGSITTELCTKEHPNKREMYATKAKDLYNWGVDDIAMKYAYEGLLKDGCKGSEQKELLDIEP